jgi:hypothetical protein
MSPGQCLTFLRLCIGIALCAYALALAIAHAMRGNMPRALCDFVLWALLGCMVAPLAEDVEHMVRALAERKKGKPG